MSDKILGYDNEGELNRLESLLIFNAYIAPYTVYIDDGYILGFSEIATFIDIYDIQAMYNRTIKGIKCDFWAQAPASLTILNTGKTEIELIGTIPSGRIVTLDTNAKVASGDTLRVSGELIVASGDTLRVSGTLIKQIGSKVTGTVTVTESGELIVATEGTVTGTTDVKVSQIGTTAELYSLRVDSSKNIIGFSSPNIITQLTIDIGLIEKAIANTINRISGNFWTQAPTSVTLTNGTTEIELSGTIPSGKTVILNTNAKVASGEKLTVSGTLTKKMEMTIHGKLTVNMTNYTVDIDSDWNIVGFSKVQNLITSIYMDIATLETKVGTITGITDNFWSTTLTDTTISNTDTNGSEIDISGEIPSGKTVILNTDANISLKTALSTEGILSVGSGVEISGLGLLRVKSGGALILFESVISTNLNIENNGSLVISDTSRSSNRAVTGTSVISGTVTSLAGASLAINMDLILSGKGNIISGTVNVSPKTRLILKGSTTFSGKVNVNNNGYINVVDITLTIVAGGIITLESNSTLTMTVGTTVTGYGFIVVNGASTISVNGGIMQIKIIYNRPTYVFNTCYYKPYTGEIFTASGKLVGYLNDGCTDKVTCQTCKKRKEDKDKI